MRIAVPIVGGKLSPHFGHCEQFALIDVEKESGTITAERYLDAPPHEPGLLPAWLAEQGANMIIAGGMGGRAQALFTQAGIEVLVGAPPEAPADLVQGYCSGALSSGSNLCDH